MMVSKVRASFGCYPPAISKSKTFARPDLVMVLVSSNMDDFGMRDGCSEAVAGARTLCWKINKHFLHDASRAAPHFCTTSRKLMLGAASRMVCISMRWYTFCVEFQTEASHLV